MKKNGFTPILIVLIFVILGVVSYFAYKNYSTNIISSVNLPVSTSTPTTIPLPTAQPFVLDTKHLVGIWHDMPMLGSGWSDHYNFYSSGKYRLYFNTMDCAKTVTDESGSWKLSGSTLTLTMTEKTVLNGGRLVPASGSCGSAQDLVGATPEKITLSVPQVTTYNISVTKGPVKLGTNMVKPEDTPYTVVLFGTKPYWKFDSDPASYGDEKFPE